MRKITVLSTHSLLENIIEELHNQEVVHIIEHDKSDELDIGSPLEQGDTVSEILVKVRSLMSLLKIDKTDSGKKVDDTYVQIKKNLEKIHDDTNILLDDIRKMDDKVRENQGRMVELHKAASLDLPIEAFHDFESLCRFTGQVNDVERLAERLGKITDTFEIFTDDNDDLVAIFAEKPHEQEVREALEKESFNEVTMDLSGLTGNIKAKIRDIEKENIKLEKDIAAIKKNISDIKKKWAPYTIAVEARLAVESEKADAPLQFASSERAFMVTGWVLAKKVDKIEAALEKLTKGKIYFKAEEPAIEEDVPVKLNNPKPSRSFEALMDLFALPMYKEMDPTFLMFLTFPLFFGFMLGDWGYGITTLILFATLKRFIPAGRQFFNILMLSSVSTIFFGILFGEFFGAEVLFGHDMWRVLSRGHEMITLLIIAICIGFLHINWGLINGFINEFRNHGFKRAMLEKGSWFILQAVVGMIVLSGMHMWRLKLWVSIIFLLIPIYMIYKGEGAQGMVEIPGIFSNMLSYARLMAIGIASVKLAEVVNEFAGKFFHSGGISIVWAILLLIVGHMVNIALGTIGPFLHSLRLHYVEYFGKFFKGGAKRFRPFGVKE